MTKKFKDEYSTETGGSTLVKTVVVGVVGAVASYYATMWAKRMLEEKPLKTRVREGREKVAQLQSAALDKASNLKSVAKDKVDRVAAKTKSLIDEKEAAMEYKAAEAEVKLEQAENDAAKLIDDKK